MNMTNPFRALRTIVAAGLLTVGCQAAFAQAPDSSNLDKKLDSPFAAFRIGVVVSPVASVDGGLDITFPRLRIAPSWASRLDLEAAARFNSRSFGSRRDADGLFTICQVYTPGGLNRGRYFLGAGAGVSVGPRSGFGGKVFAGINLSPVVSIEAEGQFVRSSPVRAVLMLRLAAL